MTLNLITYDGLDPEEGVRRILQQVSAKLDNTGKLMSNSLVQTVRRHFETTYPGSNHYSPNKVRQGNSTSNAGEAIIDVPGVSRAYHDIDIKPKFRKYLTIPLLPQSYGRKAGEFSNTFVVFPKKGHGTGLIGRKDGGTVAWLYRLVKNVHQSRDPRIMPSDNTLAVNIIGRIKAWLQKTT